MGPKKKLGGKKKDSDGSDSEREDAGNKEDKAAAAKSPRDDGDGGGKESSLPLKRGGKKATRFRKDDSDDEDAGAGDWKAEAAKKKAEREKKKEERAKELERERKEAEEGGGDPNDTSIVAGDEDVDGAAGVGGGEEGGDDANEATLKRSKEKRTRFSRIQEDEANDTYDELGSLFERHKENIPWIPYKKRLEQESAVLFRLGKRESVLKQARDQMREQGLYVAGERRLWPANVERDLLRAKVQREALAKRVKAAAATSGGGGEAANVGEGKDGEIHKVFIDPKSGMEFSADDEQFLVPFEPTKERSCRPSSRYDPSLPYMQYDSVVPTTNLDAVFGKAETQAVLDLEIRGVTLSDHPLFIEEDYLACELEDLNRKYQRRTEVNWVDFYTQKLEALTSALDTVRKEREMLAQDGPAGARKAGAPGKEGGKVSDAISKAAEQLLYDQQLEEDVRQARLQRAQEEYDDLALVSRMITVWERLKKVRTEQAFSSTKVELKFKKRNMNLARDEEQRQQELEAELGELRHKHLRDMRLREAAWEKERDKLKGQMDKLNAKIAGLLDQEAQANKGVAVEDDDDDDDDDTDGDDDDEDAMSPGSPEKKKKKSEAQADTRLVAQILDQRMMEEEMLEKMQELMDRHTAKQPKLENEPFDEDAAVASIKERHLRTKRHPGSPIYIPIFSEQKARTETGSLPATPEGAKEKKRRAKIKNVGLFMRIVVNGKTLTNSNGRPLDADLIPSPGLDFSFSFIVKEVIQLATTSGMPEIVLQLHEKGMLGGSEVASVFVPVDEEALEDRGDPLVFQGLTPWSAKDGPKGYWQGGEGVKDFVPSQQHFYTGMLFVRLNYTASHASSRGMPREGAMLISQGERRKGTLLGSGIVSANKLKKMIKLHQLDPNDPRNNHLLELLSASKEQETEKHVRFDAMLHGASIGERIVVSAKDSTVITSRWIGEQSLDCPATMRHKLLLARERNPAVFQAPQWAERAVPLVEEEIEGDDTRRDDFFDRVYANEFPEVDNEGGSRSIDNKKAKKVLQFRQKVQQQVRKQRAKAGSRKSKTYKLEDVVHQPELPEFGGFAIIEAIKYALRKRSNLRPEEKPAKVVLAAPTECNIRITVQRAQNLPVRRTAQGGSSSAQGEGGDAGRVLESIVQARFQNHEADKGNDTTPVGKGPNPAWNTPLKLRFQPWNNNWSPGNLSRVTDNLHLNVFDTKILERSDASGQVRKLEKRWLGSIQFPFNTLYSTGRIDGTFELDCPPHHIGYTRNDGKPKKEERPATIQLCIALDPPLPQPGAANELSDLHGKLQGQQQLVKRLQQWMYECSSHSSSRTRKYDACLGRTLVKDYVLATRFVTPQAPPPDAYNQEMSIEKQQLQLCRFVGLIPFLEDFHLEDTGGDDVDAESLDVWCTSAEFLDIMAGDWEEHATLLCNFFLHLKLEAYLVFGSGIPEGDTVYVMTRQRHAEGDEIHFWNASRGKRYNAKDIHCTLKEIYFIVDQHNIWGNVQSTKAIPNTRFDLDDGKAWKKLFTDKQPQNSFPQMETVQVPIDWKLSQPRDAYAEEVAKRIKLAVRNRLEHWRSKEGKSLVGNEGATRKLHDIMRKMETSAHFETEFTEENLHSELESYLQPNSATSGFNMTGFYVNRPFTDLQPILDEIYNADIHHAGPVVTDGSESDTQFAHTVYVKPFPRRILSVWICVACLSRKR